jgi:hypothetical protein
MSAAFAAGLVLARASHAKTRSATASSRYRNALIIDGNLVPPIDDAAPLDHATALAVKSSGLTALKATIGGSTGDFALRRRRRQLTRPAPRTDGNADRGERHVVRGWQQ